MQIALLMASQDQATKSTKGSSSSNHRMDECSPSGFTVHLNTSPPYEDYCGSKDLSNSSPDGNKTVARLKKSQSLGNMLEKQQDYDFAQNSEDDDENHGFALCYPHDNKNNIEESKKSGYVNFSDQNKESAIDCSLDGVHHDSSTGNMEPFDIIQSDGVDELCPDHASAFEEPLSRGHPSIRRSRSVNFVTKDADRHEGADNSEILRNCSRSSEGFSCVADVKVDYLSGDEEEHSKLNLHAHFVQPSCRDNNGASNSDEKVSLNRADADEEGGQSIASGGFDELGNEMLDHGFWKENSVCGNHSADAISPGYADSENARHHSDGSGINEAADQERHKFCSVDARYGHHSLEVCDSEDICKEVNWKETETGGTNFVPSNQVESFYHDYTELTPRAFTLKRIEDWINHINIGNDMIVEEHGESSSSAQRKVPELVAGAPAARSDAKSSLGMEMAYNYISSLTPASSSAQLTNLGLVAIPILSAFVGLRQVNLSGNFIVRISAGALPKGLHMLNLSKNNISTIEGLRELTRLRVLDISYNRISRIGHGLASCSSLKELYLAGNKISEVDGLHRLLKLKILDLRNNKVSTSKGLGQLAANYNSLEAVNLEGNPAQKNVGDEHLKKYLLSLLPHLVYYNKQSTRLSGSKEVSDRHVRITSHHTDRTARSDRKSPRRLTLGSAAHKAQSSQAARSSHISSSRGKPLKTRNVPLPLGVLKP